MSVALVMTPGTRLEGFPSIVDKVFFANDDGWAVTRFRPGANANIETFIGTGLTGSFKEGESLLLSGQWVENAKYGTQLKIEEALLPDLSGDGMFQFLVGGYVKGITERIGHEIWRAFGEETATVFEDEPERLLTIKGIGQGRYRTILASWREVAGKRVALTEFARMGLHNGIVHRLLKTFASPELALEKVKADPYLMAWDIAGVGFATADQAAMRLGFHETDPLRLGAAFGYVLDEAAKKSGHCYLDEEDLFQQVKGLLKIGNEALLRSALVRLEREGRITRTDVSGKVCVYLKKVLEAEQKVAWKIGGLVKQTFPAIQGLPELFTAYEQENRVQLGEDQKTAITTALKHQVAVITGGPGTGKTTIIKALISILRAQDQSFPIGLCAPTGRAAKRMAESTGMPAKTIHRLLEFVPGQGFAYNSDNPLQYSLVICDESSMLDIFLARSLVSAVRPEGRIIFVGDVNQLPSVGAGAFLKDLIASGCVPTTYLTRIYRQSEGSYIAHNAAAILAGDRSGLNLTNMTDDFFWMPTGAKELPVETRQEMIRDSVVKCVRRLVQKGHGLGDMMVLCPMYKGPVGVDSLNKLLQRILNPNGDILHTGRDRQFLVGDKVMQTRNNYDKGVFNGDLGYLVGEKDGCLLADFDGEIVEYKKDEFKELVLAYAMTVHKAQGAESRAVIQVLSTSHSIMLQRSILYTGVTRAKEICILVGDPVALAMAIKNNKVGTRQTNLAAYIKRNAKSVFAARAA